MEGKVWAFWETSLLPIREHFGFLKDFRITRLVWIDWLRTFRQRSAGSYFVGFLLPSLILDLLWAHQRPDKGQPQTLFIENPHNPILSSPYRKSRFMILKPSAQMFWFRDGLPRKTCIFLDFVLKRGGLPNFFHYLIHNLYVSWHFLVQIKL